MAIHLAPETRRLGVGRSLLAGGSPFRLVELSPAQADDLDRRLAGSEPTGALSPAVLRWLTDRWLLIDDATAHHRTTDRSPPGPAGGDRPSMAGPHGIDVVIICHDHEAGLHRLLARLPASGPASITVVDDGSEPPVDPSTFGDARVVLVRHDRRRGPARARNRGRQRGAAELVLFLDADIVLPDGPGAADVNGGSGVADDVIGGLVAELAADPRLVAVAPRVTADGGDRSDLIARYERRHPAADLGTTAGTVASGTRIPYLTSAALLVRRRALDEVGWFDEALRLGEDVDLVWRLGRVGSVGYRPSITVGHPPRPGLRSWLAQRFGYGRGNAALALRHPGAVFGPTVDRWSVAAWTLAFLPGGWAGVTAGVGVTVVAVALLRRRLRPLLPHADDHPGRLAIELAAGGTLWAGLGLAEAVRRHWLVPLAGLAAVVRPLRTVLVAAAIVPPMLEWLADRATIGIDPIRWPVMRALDDAAFACGQWVGVIEHGTTAPVRLGRRPLDDLIVTADRLDEVAAGPRTVG